MKHAQVLDARRRVIERAGDWHVRLERFAFEDVPSLGTSELSFSTPVSVLAGPNGVGKTTLLRAIWAAAAPALVEPSPSTALKLSAGSATLEFREGKEYLSGSVKFASGEAVGQSPLKVDVLHIDSALEPKQQQKEFCGFEDIDDIINGVGARQLDEKTLATVNYISRRDYREIKIYEVEANSRIAPFFEVSYGNDRYDSRTMGAGELAILFLWWAIDRAAESAVVLIEEPETYLSPASQEAISNVMLATAVDKHLSLIITTHSPKVLGAFPDECVKYLFRQGGSIQVVEGYPPPALLETIGIDSKIDNIFLVEDAAGDAFTRQLLERFQPGLSRRIETSVVGGDGEIISTLRKVGGRFDSVHIFGLFDGDLAGSIPEDVQLFSTTLPGERPIEKIFRDMVCDHPDELTQALGCSDLPAILFRLEGSEHHDWYHGLCDQLGLSRAQLFPILFQIWLRADGNEDTARSMVSAVAGLVASTTGTIPPSPHNG